MIKLIKNITRGFAHIAFPNVCICCGNEHTQKQRQLCSFCLEERFEDANSENSVASGDTLLPEGIMAQHALWNFDKGGDLQHLLHQLKYQRMTKVGLDLGRKLGERVEKHPLLRKNLESRESIILPVPLHYLKFRYRGFNQAFKIAQGFQQIWPQIEICDIKAVTRSKNTKTQTGFSLQKRLDNLKGAFKVREASAIKDKLVVIIDDVFTTGATTFELAKTLKKAGAGPIIVLTIAQA
ncbi:MAG TPA: ComF family protein [Balneolaceae bacterium]|nr:ComF family protein [Balneolaceae bacterium]